MKSDKYLVITINGEIVEKQVSDLHVPRDKNSVPVVAALLADRMKFSDFHIELAANPCLSVRGCTVFVGQTLVSDWMLLAIYTPKGLSSDLFFPLNSSASSLLRNSGLKVYGGAIVVRKMEDGLYPPVSKAAFFKEAMARDLCTLPSSPVSLYNPRARKGQGREKRRQERCDASRTTASTQEQDWRSVSRSESEHDKVSDCKSDDSKEKECKDSPKECPAASEPCKPPSPPPGLGPPQPVKSPEEIRKAANAFLRVGEEGIVVGLWDFVAATPLEMDVREGDHLKILERNVDSGEWSYGHQASGPRQSSTGFFPDRVLTTYPRPVRAICTRDAAAEGLGYLALTAGDEVQVLVRDLNTCHYYIRRDTHEGWAPFHAFA
jgi:hypothetical protein